MAGVTRVHGVLDERAKREWPLGVGDLSARERLDSGEWSLF